ncbi:cysteine desulfurase NifS [Sinanaerobacter chloroacetimidivorans]|jgi:cysteine desulfurase|uniref:Cysteine desulfurase IscS n=1 Tax=Sinanaerobacter chloroacetimidivorans TaxID=2818044 RepID=A0A8J7VYX7_9FIRM|nr:cysteine desulfurase NifS [Sinanaerobacter chloroacetimidivorans]MBR0596578.1 cysteine desulfurase NifS [Sinanaerobacter chloroacetimidivorans]
MRQVYLDYSATTPVKKEVLEAMLPYFTEKFGNPSSLYGIGLSAKSDLSEARAKVAKLIGTDEREIYFTSGGTEADNWAVIGTARAKKAKGNHIITSKIEHHALLHTCEYLEKEGYEVTYLDVDSKGFINLTDLENAITDKTILISIMFANNEVGTIQPIKEIGEIAKKHGILFHTDAVQALGNVPIHAHELGIDMMSMSAHKIYGPKGIGALYIRKGVVIPNLLNGGAQENKRRAGTENMAGIMGFAKAAELAEANLDEHIESITSLRNYFAKEITSKIEDIDINGDMEKRLPGNINLTFNYVEGEALLLYMDAKGIAASTGSACSSASFTPSHVLRALGLPLEKIYSSIRFTVGDFTTKDDIDYAVEEIVKIVEKLRSFSAFNKERTW